MGLPGQPCRTCPFATVAHVHNDALRPAKGWRESSNCDLTLSAVKENARIAIDGASNDHAFAKLRVLYSLPWCERINEGIIERRHQEIR